MKIRGIKSPIQVKSQQVGLGELLPLLQDLASKYQDIQKMHGEFKQLHGDVMGKIASIKQGPAGRDGIGVAGRDGISPEIDYAKIIREVTRMIPRAKDGKDGKPGEKLTPDEVIKALFSPERMDLQQIIDMRLDPHVQNLRRLVMRGGGAVVAYGSNTPGKINMVFDEDVAKGASGTSFTLAHVPVAGSVALHRGGARQTSKTTTTTADFSISGATITLTTALTAGETLTADYAYTN